MKTRGRLYVRRGPILLKANSSRTAPAMPIVAHMFRAIPAGSPTRLVDAYPLPPATNATVYVPFEESGNEFFERYPAAPYVKFSAPTAGEITIRVEGYDKYGIPTVSGVTVPAGSTFAWLLKAFSKITLIRVQTTASEIGRTISIGDCDPTHSFPQNRVPGLGLPFIYATWGYSAIGTRRSAPDAEWARNYHGAWQAGGLHKDVSTHYDPRGLWWPHPSPPWTSGLPDGVADYCVAHHINFRHIDFIRRIPRRIQ